MHDLSFVREEDELRETLKSILNHAGVSDGEDRFTLNRAKAVERGYILTAHPAVASFLRDHLNAVAGLTDYGRVWVLLRPDAQKIVREWRLFQEGVKK